MRVITWNVNSVRVRQERLLALLARHAPDVLCLQELKVESGGYPHEAVQAAGYHSTVLGQKTYNGVAVLTRAAATEPLVGLDDGVDDPQARLISVRVAGVRVVSVYVPNGGVMGSDKWQYKLAWLARLRRWLERHARPEEPLVLCGDFNVAPEALDVHDTDAWINEPLYHPEARAALQGVLDWGLADTFRPLHPEEPGLYSWWDYRMLAFPKNRGLRIDHIFATVPLAARAERAFIDRDERKGESPSDHAPVVVDFRET